MIIGLDVDDVLFCLNERVINIVNEKFDQNYIYDEVDWSFSNIDNQEHLDFVDSLYRDKEFMSSLELFDGAYEFVEELNELGTVVFITAVYKESMEVRKNQLKNIFPFIPESNTILTSRKDLIHLDVIIDDSYRNVSTSRADTKVLVSRPWNRDLDYNGMIRTDCYNEIINTLKKP